MNFSRRSGAWGAKDNSESGRSMVEMLGVLAIIGVLSVGGVAGYNFAMTRYRANEIIEGVKQRATVGSGQYLQGMEAINLSEFPSTILEYETEGFDEGLNGEKDLFSIDVKEVPRAVCQDILDRNWTWPAGIFVNERDIPCPEGNSKMTFVFAGDLNERTDAEAYDPCWDKTCCRVTDPNTLAFEEGQNLSNKECQKTAANNLTCCTTANTRQCYFDQASIDRYGPHQNTIADCTNDGLHRCDGDLNCVCTTRCTNPDKVQNPNTCACTCPTGVPNADDSACVECNIDSDCAGRADGKTLCDTEDNNTCCEPSSTDPTKCKKACVGEAPNACKKCDDTKGEWVNKDNGTLVGDCGKCQNGQVVADTSKYDTDCQTCLAENNWEQKPRENGSNKQSDGKCCINGALGYDDNLCPDNNGPIEFTQRCYKTSAGRSFSLCEFQIPSQYKNNYIAYATGYTKVSPVQMSCSESYVSIDVYTSDEKTQLLHEKINSKGRGRANKPPACSNEEITCNQREFGPYPPGTKFKFRASHTAYQGTGAVNMEIKFIRSN